MATKDLIKQMRELKQLSQEQMAEKLNMSTSGYAKIERGETKLRLDKLEQIAQILDIDIVELIQAGEKNVLLQINENSYLNSSFQCASEETLLFEIEKLKLSLSHLKQFSEEKEAHLTQLLSQKENEILALKETISVLKSNYQK